MDKNNTTITVSTEEKEAELDLLNLLAECLLQWKKFLAMILIGAILGFGVAALKNSKVETLTIEEAVASAKAQLSSEKVVAVEQLFLQYVTCKEYQEELLAKNAGNDSDVKSQAPTVSLRTGYYIFSKLSDIDRVFINLALTDDDYRVMREIASDEETGAAIYDRIVLTMAYTEMKSNTGAVVNIPPQDDGREACLVNVEIYGTSEEQCCELKAAVDAAFQRKADELKALDSEIRLESLGETLSYNVTDYLESLHKKDITRLTSSETEMTNLNTKAGKLSSEEQNYYNLLKLQYEGGSLARVQVSQKKWIAIGVFGGFVLAFCAVFLPYLLNGRIQSYSEMELNCVLLNRVFIKSRKNLFGEWAARLIHADDIDPAVKADMVAADIGILMEKYGKNKLMLLYNGEDAGAAGFVEQVKARLQAKNSSLQISMGNPINSVDELRMVAQADIGVAFAEMKKSKRTVLREWKQICERYKLLLAGSVTVRQCW